MPRVLFVSSEAWPLIKTGGLADVAGSLPPALNQLGHDTRLLLPAYPATLDTALAWGVRTVASMQCGGHPSDLLETRSPDTGQTVWLLSSRGLFDRPGNPYHDQHGQDWPDNHHRFALLCQVAVSLAMGRTALSWRPELVHCNDWQTGLIPALLSLEAERPATVFTIHNLAYRGLFPWQAFDELELPDSFRSHHSLEFHNQLSFIKGGIVYADRVNTVSPSYAREIQSEAFGCGLDGLLRHRRAALSGIVNGIDTQLWNPADDAHLIQAYQRDSLKKKAANKTALRREFGLGENDDAPLIGFIGRLVEQKGIDLLLNAAAKVHHRCRWVILGSGEPYFEQQLSRLAASQPRRIALRLGYDEALAHRIEAGADLFLMPSRFEPCGLNQMYSLRYGTIPVVHRVGGLADTVVDATPQSLLAGTANGFSFDLPRDNAVDAALARALNAYCDAALWRSLQRTGMDQDLSWRRSAEQYQALYRQAIELRG